MGKKSSKQTVGPSKFAKPYISAAGNAVRDAFNGNQQNIADLTGTLKENLPGVLGQTLNNPNIAAAGDYTRDVLGGRYLDEGNPYLEQQIANTNSSVANGVNAAIGSRGGAGGSAQAQILARELAKNESALRYGDYNSERDRMGTAANTAGSLAAAGNSGIGALLAYIQSQATLPQSGAESYAGSIGNLMGNYTTKTTQNSTFDNLMNLISAGSSAYKAAMGGGG